MRNFKFYLPVLLIALGCTLTSCPNEQARKEYEKEQSRPKIEIPSLEDVSTPLEKNIEDQISNHGMHK